MRSFIVLALASSIVLTACTDSRTPSPAPTPRATEGGPCGDGTVLQPGEQCR